MPAVVGPALSSSEDWMKHHARLARALGVPSAFPWQITLLDRMLAADLPAAVDVPTGLGKTAVMAVWLVARMAGAALPRRLVYVVDRRAVVDQATAVAEQLQRFVEREVASDSAVKGRLGLADGRELPISTLRGQHVDNSKWLGDPGSAAIVLGTADMVGSRLLFQGYGVSRKMRPYHAGLIGADTLVVLDEAHLVQPFQRLLEVIATRAAKLAPSEAVAALVPRFRLLPLSATGATSPGDAIALSAADHADPVVRKRIDAPKSVVLRDAVDAKDLATILASEAWALSSEGVRAVRVIVFCNSRRDADVVHANLAKKLGPAASDRLVLFVGARRVHERDQAAKNLAVLGFLAGSDVVRERASFVVATSAAEVGVDLDADHMVSDLVPFERIVQRLGRVNRRGDGAAEVIVVPTRPSEKAKDDEQRRLERLDATRALLKELPKDGAGVSGSPRALVELRDKEPHRVAAASSEVPLYPPLSRPLVEAWSMTSLDDHTGRPEVSPWLRGWVDDEPQTTVVWRRVLPAIDGTRLFAARELDAFFDAAGPHLAEQLETETAHVVEWLGERLTQAIAPSDESADHHSDEDAEQEEALVPEEALDERPSEERRGKLRPKEIAAVILGGRRGDAPRTLSLIDFDAHALERDLAGATIIVDERVGGLREGLLSVESNVADEVPGDRVGFRVARVTTGEPTEHDRRPQRDQAWREELRVAVRTGLGDEEPAEWIIVESRVDSPAESEEGRSVSPKHEQLLDEHQAWTANAARALAAHLELPAPYAELLVLAARLHDEGKRASNWQRAFRAKSDAAYAKTTHRPLLSILDGYRHELGSLPRAEKHPDVKKLSPELRDLCLHLIAAHHGGARPLLRTDGAEEPPTRLAARAQEIALRFARLEKVWGPWGLAWWEALLRASDQQASRQNDARTDRGGRDG